MELAHAHMDTQKVFYDLREIPQQNGNGAANMQRASSPSSFNSLQSLNMLLVIWILEIFGDLRYITQPRPLLFLLKLVTRVESPQTL
jgi:hypothetical protein